MNELFEASLFAGVVLSLATYEIGILLKKKLKLAIFNPLLVSVVLCIVILKLVHIDYETYEMSAKYISWFLTPATVCLAIPLYEQIELLKKNYVAIFAGILSGALSGMGVVFVLSKLFSLNHKEYVTLLPKSITTAIGMGVSKELGGYVTITVAVIVITGVLGNIMAEFVFKIFRIKEPVSKGISIGTAAHAIGTAKAIELGEIEGAMSSLSIAVCGIITVILSPVFAGFL